MQATAIPSAGGESLPGYAFGALQYLASILHEIGTFWALAGLAGFFIGMIGLVIVFLGPQRLAGAGMAIVGLLILVLFGVQVSSVAIVPSPTPTSTATPTSTSIRSRRPTSAPPATNTPLPPSTPTRPGKTQLQPGNLHAGGKGIAGEVTYTIVRSQLQIYDSDTLLLKLAIGMKNKGDMAAVFWVNQFRLLVDGALNAPMLDRVKTPLPPQEEIVGEIRFLLANDASSATLLIATYGFGWGGDRYGSTASIGIDLRGAEP